MRVEAVGGRHDGDEIELRDGTHEVHVPYFTEHMNHVSVVNENWMFEVDPYGPVYPSQWGRAVYQIRPHPHRAGWGAVYAPIYWPCSKKDHR